MWGKMWSKQSLETGKPKTNAGKKMVPHVTRYDESDCTQNLQPDKQLRANTEYKQIKVIIDCGQ
jgi:hypothetical protein